MADKGYVGAEKGRPGLPVVIPPKAPRGGALTDGQKGYNRRVSRRRVVVEHGFAQFSRFPALRQSFRSVVGRHTRVVRVVAWLVDRRMQANRAEQANAAWTTTDYRAGDSPHTIAQRP
jgi:hypothetical protein